MLSQHLLRGGLAAVTTLVLYATLRRSYQANVSGLDLLSSLSECWYWCLVLVGTQYFSAAVAEEKDEDTLSLLRMTGIRDATLLLGKSLPRLVSVLFLFVLSLPLVLLARTLGGVLAGHIAGLVIGYAAFAFCLCQAGLFAGTVCRTSQGAKSVTLVLWLLTEFAGDVLQLGGLATRMTMGDGSWLAPAARLSMSVGSEVKTWSLWAATSEYLFAGDGELILQGQILWHLMVGVLLFGLSLLLFDRCSRRSSGAEPFVARPAGTAAVVSRGRKGGTRRFGWTWSRPVNNALAWKSWQITFGGWMWYTIVAVGLPALCLSVLVLASFMIGQTAPPFAIGLTLLIVGAVGTAGLTLMLCGRVLSDEIRQQTLTTLCTLPCSHGSLVWSLIIGILPALTAPLPCVMTGFLILLSSGDFVQREFLNGLAHPFCWLLISWGVNTLVLGVLLSLWLRTGGMLTALAVNWVGAPFMVGAFASIFLVGPRRDSETAFFIFLLVNSLMLTVVWWHCILRRISTLADR